MKISYLESTDARPRIPKAQYELRTLVIRFRGKGLSSQETAEMVGIPESRASTLWRTNQRHGIEVTVRGRRTGMNRRRSPERELAMQNLLVDITPDQLKLPFALWTRDAVRLRWGYTPRKHDPGYHRQRQGPFHALP